MIEYCRSIQAILFMDCIFK